MVDKTAPAVDKTPSLSTARPAFVNRPPRFCQPTAPPPAPLLQHEGSQTPNPFTNDCHEGPQTPNPSTNDCRAQNLLAPQFEHQGTRGHETGTRGDSYPCLKSMHKICGVLRRFAGNFEKSISPSENTKIILNVRRLKFASRLLLNLYQVLVARWCGAAEEVLASWPGLSPWRARDCPTLEPRR